MAADKCKADLGVAPIPVGIEDSSVPVCQRVEAASMMLEVRGQSYFVRQAGSGPPLLLLHGFTGSADEWAGQARVWEGRFTSIAVDLLGHGRSAAPAAAARYSMDEAVADLAEILDRLGVDRAHVLGYSMGGRLALHFAVAHPARVRALVLESASAGLAGPAERAARVAADDELACRIEREGVEAFVEHWQALPLWASQERLPVAVREALRQRRLRSRAEGLAGSLRGLGTGAQRPLHEALGGLHLPVLCVAGELDRKFAALAREMARALPRGELWLVPGAGHAVHIEAPDRFANTIVGFLNRHDCC